MGGTKYFTLDDGTTVTTEQVAKKLGCSIHTAYSRLARNSDPERVYRPLSKTKTGAVYILDDGSEWTSASLAKHLKIKRSTAGSRLSQSSDPKRVLAEPRAGTTCDKQPSLSNYSKKVIQQRMYFDPDGFWKLINKAT